MEMIFRFYFQERGGHTHVRVFAGEQDGNLGKCGDLVFRNEEWDIFTMEHSDTIEFIDDDTSLPLFSNVEATGS